MADDEILPGIACGWKNCVRRFHSVMDLRNHVCADHLKYFPYSCPLCSFARFPTQETLAKHIQICHSGKETTKATVDIDNEKIDALDKCLWESLKKEADTAGTKPIPNDNLATSTAEINRVGGSGAETITTRKGGSIHCASNLFSVGMESAETVSVKSSRKRQIAEAADGLSVSAKRSKGARGQIDFVVTPENEQCGRAEPNEALEIPRVSSVTKRPRQTRSIVRMEHEAPETVPVSSAGKRCKDARGRAGNFLRPERVVEPNEAPETPVSSAEKISKNAQGQTGNILTPEDDEELNEAPATPPVSIARNTGNFFCHQCMKSIPRKNEETVRLHHVYKKHLGKVKFLRCPICDYENRGNSTNMNRHIRNVHKIVDSGIVQEKWNDTIATAYAQCFPESGANMKNSSLGDAQQTDKSQSAVNLKVQSGRVEKRPKTKKKRTEAGKRRYFCESCGRYSNEGVRRHIYKKHLMTYVMKCSECEYGHRYEANIVKAHILRKHADVPNAVVRDFKADFEDDVQRLMNECFPGYKEKEGTSERYRKVRISGSGAEGETLLKELAASSPVRVKVEVTPGNQEDEELVIIEENC